MSKNNKATIKVMKGENKQELMLCVGDSEEGFTYQNINNNKLVSLISSVTGGMLPGQSANICLSIESLPD